MRYSVDFEGRTSHYVEVAPDRWFPIEVQASGPVPGLLSGLQCHAVFCLAINGPRYHLRSVELFREHDSGAELDAEALRKISITSMLEGIPHAVMKTSAELRGGVNAGSERLPTADARLVEVAQIYVSARLSGARPAKRLRDRRGLPSSTATYLIRLAKEKGYIAGVRGAVEVTA